jgi:hypothetical protein
VLIADLDKEHEKIVFSLKEKIEEKEQSQA